MELAFGIVLLVMALFLVVAVALQTGKEKGLGGTISGGMDNGFGGNTANRDRKLSILTAVVSIVFVLVVVVMYIVVS